MAVIGDMSSLNYLHAFGVIVSLAVEACFYLPLGENGVLSCSSGAGIFMTSSRLLRYSKLRVGC